MLYVKANRLVYCTASVALDIHCLVSSYKVSIYVFCWDGLNFETLDWTFNTLWRTRLQIHNTKLRKAKRVTCNEQERKKKRKTHHAVSFTGEKYVVDRHFSSPSITSSPCNWYHWSFSDRGPRANQAGMGQQASAFSTASVSSSEKEIQKAAVQLRTSPNLFAFIARGSLFFESCQAFESVLRWNNLKDGTSL